MNIVAKKCTVCFEVLPMGDFRFMTDKMRYSPRCHTCERQRALVDYHERASKRKTWALSELDLLHDHYPKGGVAAVQAYLPKRSKKGIQQAALRAGLSYTAPRICGVKPKEAPWAVPRHEYTEPDMALRLWHDVGAIPVLRQALRCAL